MKVVLSRKGFDSKYGGQPSPILPDGTLLSLPIPIEDEPTTFGNIYYEGKSYFEIIQELKPATKLTASSGCHLDPDIRKNIIKAEIKNWRPIFGQAEAAQGHLQNNSIAVNDMFLFLGWFRETEFKNGKLAYKLNRPGVHLIYGYLQVGEICTDSNNLPAHVKQHTHAGEKHMKMKNNCMYVATEKLSFNKTLEGAGCLKYKPTLLLTNEGMTRSKWKLPNFFNEVEITYHSKTSFKENYFQSAAIGQEFVISSDKQELENWVKDIIN